MQEQLKDKKCTEELRCWNTKEKQENNTKNAESAFSQVEKAVPAKQQ